MTRALQLHEYQRQAVQFLQERGRAGLFLDMGLGKTAITLSALTPDHLPALVTAPRRVTSEVWPTEAALWRPDLSIATAVGTPKQRAAAFESQADITVISRDNLAQAEEYAARYRTFIVDELSGFKSPSSVRFKTARRLVRRRSSGQPPIPYRWGLTGTPNGLLDLWSQIFLLDDGERLGTTVTGFRNRYFMPGRQLANGVITEWILRPEADKNIHSLLDDLCLSMGTEGRVDLPPLTYNAVSVPLPPEARRLYKTMKDKLVVYLDLLGGSVHTAANAAVLSNRLSQLSAGFLYPDDYTYLDAADQAAAYTVVHREKVQAAQEIVEGTGSPVLVFYRYRAELTELQRALPGAATLDEPGVVRRWNEGNVPVLLAHPASAGHGLNLQHGGHTIVWTSLPWSLEEWEQSNKRLARQGQRHPVVVHMLLSPRTVDGAIRDRLLNKKTVQDALLSHLESPL